MIIVDLQDLEYRARTASASIGGVVLEPDALLLIVSEIRRMKTQIGEQHSNLLVMRNELLQLRTELAGSPAYDEASEKNPRQTKLKMKVVAKGAKENKNTAA